MSEYYTIKVFTPTNKGKTISAFYEKIHDLNGCLCKTDDIFTLIDHLNERIDHVNAVNPRAKQLLPIVKKIETAAAGHVPIFYYLDDIRHSNVIWLVPTCNFKVKVTLG